MLGRLACPPLSAMALLFMLAAAGMVNAQEFDYVEKIVVAEPTELDWVFPLLAKSLAAAPEGLAKETTRGGRFSYEFFGPTEEDAGGGAWPLVIFVSPQDRPVGQHFWAPTCEEHGVLFAGVRDAGNGVPESRRVRAVLETLGDVQRRFRVDPERTYLAGFSGGAHVACRVAFALPEYVAGVVCIGHAPQPPADPWARQRLSERLSLAIVCGDREPAGPWVEDLHGPMFQAIGVRTETLILRRHGHTMPDAEVMERAFVWLEEGVEARKELKQRLPLSSLGQSLSREDWSNGMLEEAKGRLESPKTVGVGLWQLGAIVKRWNDLPAASEAQRLITEYERRTERPWMVEQEKVQRRVDRAEAEGYERLATRGEPAIRSQRGALLQRAVQFWEELATESKEPLEQAEAAAKLIVLRELAAKAPVEKGAVPLGDIRFGLVGEVTLAEGVEYLRRALAPLGYKMTVDADAELIIAGGGERKIKLDLPAATFSDVDRRFLRRNGLKSVRKKNVIQLMPLEAKVDAAR